MDFDSAAVKFFSEKCLLQETRTVPLIELSEAFYAYITSRGVTLDKSTVIDVMYKFMVQRIPSVNFIPVKKVEICFNIGLGDNNKESKMVENNLKLIKAKIKPWLLTGSDENKARAYETDLSSKTDEEKKMFKDAFRMINICLNCEESDKFLILEKMDVCESKEASAFSYVNTRCPRYCSNVQWLYEAIFWQLMKLRLHLRDEYGLTLQSVMPGPARLYREGTAADPATRAKVWDKYRDPTTNTAKCACCLRVLTENKWNCSHVVSKMNGGLGEIENLRVCCRDCNAEMGTQDMRVFIYEKKLPGRVHKENNVVVL